MSTPTPREAADDMEKWLAVSGEPEGAWTQRLRVLIDHARPDAVNEDGTAGSVRDPSRSPAMDPWRRLLDAAERSVREHGWDVEIAIAVAMARHALDTAIEPREIDADCPVCRGYRRTVLRDDIVAWHDSGHRPGLIDERASRALAAACRRGYEDSARVDADPGDEPEVPDDLAPVQQGQSGHLEACRALVMPDRSDFPLTCWDDLICGNLVHDQGDDCGNQDRHVETIDLADLARLAR